jgi:hypothetical protein
MVMNCVPVMNWLYMLCMRSLYLQHSTYHRCWQQPKAVLHSWRARDARAAAILLPLTQQGHPAQPICTGEFSQIVHSVLKN